MPLQEYIARKNGYEGEWPPKPVPSCETVEDVESRIVSLEEGDHRTSMVQTAVGGCVSLIESLDPDSFRRLGKCLVQAAKSKKNSGKSRLRAVAMATRPLLGIARMALASRKHGITNIVSQRAGRLLEAFLQGIGDDGFKELGRIADDHFKNWRASGNLTSIRTVVKMVEDIYNAAGTLELAIAQPRRNESAPSPPRLVGTTAVGREIEEIKRRANA